MRTDAVLQGGLKTLFTFYMRTDVVYQILPM